MTIDELREEKIQQALLEFYNKISCTCTVSEPVWFFSLKNISPVI